MTKNQKPIEGLVYRCNECEDYDLCSTCFKNCSEHHPLHEFKVYENKKFKGFEKAKKQENVTNYETELTLLKEMGFENTDLNKSLLQKSFGSLQDVVKELIQLN